MNTQIQEIWADLHDELKKFILNKVKDIATSEDILQEVFLKIYLNIHTLADSSKLTSWVYQITRNAVVDHYRKTNFEVQIDGFDFAEQEDEEPSYLSLGNCINQKIYRLPEEYKQVILLTYLDGYAQFALAEKLNLSYSGVKSRVQRGREKLKKLVLNCPNVKIGNKGNPVAHGSTEK